VGFLPHPRDWVLLDGDAWRAWGVLSLGAIGQLAVFVPFALALLIAVRGARPLVLTAGLLAGLALFLGLLVSLVTALFSGGGAAVVLLKGVLLTMAAVGTLLWAARDDLASRGRRLARHVLLIPAAAAAWSLACVPAVMAQASRLAQDAPFCVARHEPGPSPVRSLWDLRGFSLHTAPSGYKGTSRWYCHGLLVVDSPEGERLFNWSPRRMRFDPIDRPDLFTASLQNVCTPQGRFWRSLWMG
jgi:vacuolar-type H+-ATPase subunit I/STV1